ncbi:VOC family protein [Paenibacillus sp. GCM10023252]|uniref:VOC family protein n=1 Tax=Paenibacillus sp. GCM10023252 TaxID=3252649 RepID=UPI00360E5B47
MAKLRPYLYCEDARTQAAYYAKVLGGDIRRIQTFGDMPGVRDEWKDRVMHLVLEAAGVTFYLADGELAERGTKGLDLVLEFPSDTAAKGAYEGLAAGGRIIMEFEKMFWGAMFGRVEDRFGVRWQIATDERQSQGFGD